MKLEALPAAKGDCLVLTHGTDADPKLIVIDGGPSGVYPTLRKRLLAIRNNRIAKGLISDGDPLLIDLLIVSHIDDDHINGIKAMLGEMLQRQNDNQPALFIIGRLWHNSFNTLVGAKKPITIPPAIIASLGGHGDLEGDGEEHDINKILASVEQGFDVLNLAKALNMPVNPEFTGGLVIANETPLTIDGLSVTVLGPMLPELTKLQADFATWLVAHPDKAVTASLLASFGDTSVPNLSSIVLLVEDGAQRFLLTGDARGDKIMKAAKALDLLNADERLPVDLLKVPHHGSDRNTAASFFAMFPAPHYIFSGNGEHGNPERATLGFLAAGRPGVPLTIELTYSPAEIDQGREVDWETKKRPRKPAIGPWKEAEYGIVPFLAATPEFTVVNP